MTQKSNLSHTFSATKQIKQKGKEKGIKAMCGNQKIKTKKGFLIRTHDPTNDAAHSAVVPNILAAYFLGRGQSYRLHRKLLLWFLRGGGGSVGRFISRIRSHSRSRSSNPKPINSIKISACVCVSVWEAKDEDG